MEHVKTPKNPELNPQTAPMWALWHCHSRDLHHGMHPFGNIPPSSVGAKPNGQNHILHGPTSVKSVPPAPALTAGSKEAALAQLAEKIRQFKEPKIAQTAINMVFADGNPHSTIMLIGEAPGAEEDRQGKPFVGASGKLLDAMMASIQLDRTQTYITNVVPWRPPFNRQPSGAEIKMFLPFLQEHIHLINPRVLICVGGVAAKAVLNLDQTLTKSQGQLLSYTDPLSHHVIPAWTLYHPAYLMRAPGQKRAAWEQLLRIKAFLNN